MLFFSHVIGPCAPTPRGNFLFLFEEKTRRKSASLEPSIGLLMFVVGTL